MKDRERIHDWLGRADFDAIDDYARTHRCTLSYLTALTYDPQAIIRWRAINAIERVAAIQVALDAEHVRVHLRRLAWLLTDESGGIGWHAPEAMGAIIAGCPDTFGEFIPILIAVLDMETEDAPPFRPGALWAIARLAVRLPGKFESATPYLLEQLDDPNPMARAFAAAGLLNTGTKIPAERIETLCQDQATFEIYQNGQVQQVSVAACLKDPANYLS